MQFMKLVVLHGTRFSTLIESLRTCDIFQQNFSMSVGWTECFL